MTILRPDASVLVIAMFLFACSDSAGTSMPPTGTTEVQGVVAARTQVLDDLGRNVVVPGYVSLAESAAALRSNLEALCPSPTADDMDQSRELWHAGLHNWMMIQAYRSGPLQDLDLSASIFYPIDLNKVDQNAASGVTDLSNVGSDAKGLGAIGHLLYASEEPGEAACVYIVAMATRVEEVARTVSEAWNERIEGGLSAAFPTTQAGIEMLINDVIGAVGESAGYLGNPPAEIAPEHGEGRDFDEIGARLLGVRDVYQGAGGEGLSRLVQLAFAPTNERMSERLETALVLLSAATSNPTRDQYASTYEAVAAVHRTLTTEIASQLGATLMFGDSDGDS